jgi:uncharacterized protein YndB with AHSA1/START domain
MSNPAAVHSTFVLERSYPQSPDRVFAAFAQPSRKRRWYAEGDHEIQEFEMEFRVGGSERFSYRFKEGHPIAGSAIANETTYQEILTNQRIVMTSKMTLNGKPVQIMLATIEFLAEGRGTNLHFTHQGTYLDWPDGAAMLEQGWRSLFERLSGELAR